MMDLRKGGKKIGMQNTNTTFETKRRGLAGSIAKRMKTKRPKWNKKAERSPIDRAARGKINCAPKEKEEAGRALGRKNTNARRQFKK